MSLAVSLLLSHVQYLTFFSHPAFYVLRLFYRSSFRFVESRIPSGPGTLELSV